MSKDPLLTGIDGFPKYEPELSKAPEVSQECSPEVQSNDDACRRWGFEYKRMNPRESEVDRVLSLIEKDDWRIISFRFWPGRFYPKGGGYEILVEKPKWKK